MKAGLDGDRPRQAPAVVARERALGAQLGEDRDHRAADVVANLRVGEGGLEQLQGGLVIAAVPGLEGRLEVGAGRSCGWLPASASLK